jgi:hypothetical protein
VKILLLATLLLAPQAKPAEKCTLSGTVVNAANGEPLKNTRILAEGGSSEERAIPATTSDAKGHFQLVGLSAGQYRVQGQRNGFLNGFYGARRPESEGTPITLQAGDEVTGLEIKLTPAGVIAGAIHDAEGEPLAGIPVTVHRLRFEEGRRRIVQVGGTYADDLGQYRIPGLAPGKYYVYAQAGKANELDTVTRPEPVTEDHSPKGSPRPLTLLSALYPGVQDPAAARAVEVGPGARITGVDIVLKRSTTVSVSGRVSAPPGMRVSSIKLDDVHSENGQLGLHLVARADPKDEFEFRGVPPGNYELTASAGIPVKALGGTVEMFPEDFKARVPIQVGTSAVENVRLMMQAGAEIEGHVRVAGDETADLTGNQVIFDDGEFEPDDAMISAGNRFKLSLAVGHYAIRPTLAHGDLVVRSIEAEGKNLADDSLAISGPGTHAVEITLAHDGGQLAGVALDAGDKPAAGATIILAPKGKLASRADLFKQCQSDQSGRFLMDGITPGEYQVLALDDPEPGAWWDPDFLKKQEGVPVSIAAKSAVGAKVHVARQESH